MSTLPNQVNYKPIAEVNPRYRFQRLALNNITGNQITNISNGAQTLIEWKLPISVYNLSRSYMTYEYSFPVQSSTTASWSNEDTFEGSSIQFGTGGGLNLCDLQYSNNYVKIARKIDTPFTDYITNDPTQALYPNQFYKDGAGFNYLPAAVTMPTNNPYGIAAGSWGVGTGGSIESQYLVPSALNAAQVRYRQLPLHAFKETIFALDKDLYFGMEMYIRIQVGPGSKLAFVSTDVTVPATGAANLIVPPNMNNIYLYLAVEQDQSIIDAVISSYHKGMLKFQMPYTTAFRNSSSGTVANIQLQLTRQYGKRVKRIMHTVWNATESANTMYDCNNWNGEKIASYQTFLDNKPLQDFISSCALAGSATDVLGMDDWRNNLEHCDKSVILNAGVYQTNWFHMDKFSIDNVNADDANLDVGLLLDTVKLWQIQCTTANANLVHYTYITFLKDVACTTSGPVFD
jgi:hypothetical protein